MYLLNELRSVMLIKMKWVFPDIPDDRRMPMIKKHMDLY